MNEHEISDVSDVSVSADGETIKLTIMTNNGASLPLSFQHVEFTAFLQNMIGVGAQASEHRTRGKPEPIAIGPTPPKFSPHSLATQIGLAELPDRSAMFLVVRLFDMDLSFRVEKPTLRRLAQAFGQAVQALDADESKPH